MEEMKCLFCQRSNGFDFKHIRWPDNTPERAFYLCPYCGKNIYTIPQQAHTYCLQGNGIDRADTAGCNGRGWREDVSYTLNTVDRPAAMVAAASGIQCGNPWDPQSERIFTGDGAWHSLSANSNGGQSRDAVLVFDARGNGDGVTVPTITGDHENRITDYTAICIGNGQTNNISMAEIANTLDAMHDQQAVMQYVPGVGKALKGKSNCDFREDSETYIVQNSVVRRLTPLECDRLQGYPDNWTDIGEWTDSKGKKHDTSDSNRYRADGNSIALPFWFWLLRRISAQYERPATLGSLFDGIGGFPLCWERCIGKGTALWASEIDEFAIAVTRRRFGE